MDIYFHIGRHKTGTTSIQQALHLCRDELCESGMFYPSCDLSAFGWDEKDAHHFNHNSLAKAIQQQQIGLAQIYITSCIQQAKAANCHTLIFSAEEFQKLKSPQILRDLCHGLTVHVICYIRNSADYCVSTYQQKIYNTNFGLLFRDYFKGYKLSVLPFMQKWSAEFGDKCTFHVFSKKTLAMGDCVIDFFKFFGINIDSSKLNSLPHSNPSISGNLLLYKRCYNLLSRGDSGYHAWKSVKHIVLPLLDQLALSNPSWIGKFKISERDAFSLNKFSRKESREIRKSFGLVIPKSLHPLGNPIDLSSYEIDVKIIESKFSDLGLKAPGVPEVTKILEQYLA